MRDADDASLEHCVVGVEHVLDLAWPHLVTTCDDHVLLAVDEVVPARLVGIRDISGQQPAVAKRRRRRIAPVAGHDLRTADGKLANLV
jgi:hypothetical protein